MKYHWFHNASGDGCEFFSTPINAQMPNEATYGPFESFAKAKKDAVEYYRADLNEARRRIAEVRSRRKWDAFSKKAAV